MEILSLVALCCGVAAWVFLLMSIHRPAAPVLKITAQVLAVLGGALGIVCAAKPPAEGARRNRSIVRWALLASALAAAVCVAT